jgi:hypothetical protein
MFWIYVGCSVASLGGAVLTALTGSVILGLLATFAGWAMSIVTVIPVAGVAMFGTGKLWDAVAEHAPRVGGFLGNATASLRTKFA